MSAKKIALIGNPNVGKSSLFNALTNLRQKIGNYPGITVEKKVGFLKHQQKDYEIIDFPGIYSLYPNSLDESLVFDIISTPKSPFYPDLVVVISDPFNLNRGVVLYQQVREMGLPAIFVVNMMDEAEKNGMSIDLLKLENLLQTKVFGISARKKTGLDDLKNAFETEIPEFETVFDIPKNFHPAISDLKENFPEFENYHLWHFLSQSQRVVKDDALNQRIETIKSKHKIIPKRLQVKETLDRNVFVDEQLKEIIIYPNPKKSLTKKLDEILIHPIFGYIIFFVLLLLIFQAVYTWSGPLMDLIDNGFADLVTFLHEKIPAGPMTDLLTDGIISGIGGIVIFIPQIAILFLFISIMEESGYMSRVVFLMDKWLRPFGLNGKSAVPLVSGIACAVPAIMSARNIENHKERLITMLVTPFMTCSARLPIYIILIGLVIPHKSFMGMDYQGLALFGLYILGLLAALLSAWILSKVLKSNFKSYLILEMPSYKNPDWKNVAYNVWVKTSGFVTGAGKIILALSIILWVLGSFGVGEKFAKAEEIVGTQNPNATPEKLENELKSYRLEHSFLGNMGQAIEPIIKPLGYDWKMGIGLISSFAAREVFVSTMATVYSLGDTDEDSTIKNRMSKEMNRNTGKPAYNLASGVSMLLFYAFAMQCMSTIATVRKETNSWKWTFIQLTFMTLLAYFAAFVAYQSLK